MWRIFVGRRHFRQQISFSTARFHFSTDFTFRQQDFIFRQQDFLFRQEDFIFRQHISFFDSKISFFDNTDFGRREQQQQERPWPNPGRLAVQSDFLNIVFFSPKLFWPVFSPFELGTCLAGSFFSHSARLVFILFFLSETKFF